MYRSYRIIKTGEKYFIQFRRYFFWSMLGWKTYQLDYCRHGSGLYENVFFDTYYQAEDYLKSTNKFDNLVNNKENFK